MMALYGLAVCVIMGDDEDDTREFTTCDSNWITSVDGASAEAATL